MGSELFNKTEEPLMLTESQWRKRFSMPVDPWYRKFRDVFGFNLPSRDDYPEGVYQVYEEDEF